uniref:VOC domain-containing protein n=1 Tax=Eucampia antarctica TaxID=49252 RepID=A0A7S2QZU3_9STRA
MSNGSSSKHLFHVFSKNMISKSNATKKLHRNLLISNRRELSSDTNLVIRPFKVLGLQQIAVGSTDQKSMTELWNGILGLNQTGAFQSVKENVDEVIMSLGPDETPYAVEVDLMTPLDELKTPKVHVPPLNHIGLWVDDLPAAVEWMSSKGVRFTPGGIRRGASDHDVTFIHPKANEDFPISGCGVLIELVQAPPNVIAALKK